MSTKEQRKMLVDAAKHLRSAINLLDEAEAPGHIAAHVDLAVDQLDKLIDLDAPAKGELPLRVAGSPAKAGI